MKPVKPWRVSLTNLSAVLIAILVTLITTGTAFGRGCVLEGTPIDTPTGPVAVEQLRPGDRVWAIINGKRIPAKVQACYQTTADSYVSLRAGGHALSVTADHPIELSPGVFQSAGELHAGELVQTWETPTAATDKPALFRTALTAVTRSTGPAKAFNLLVWPGGTYIAGGIVVHNKGCFLPETVVELADGQSRRIDQIQPGDQVRAFSPDGQIVSTTVRRVLVVQADAYLLVQTESRSLRVTPEHPFFVGKGSFRTVESLHVGDSVYVLSGNALRPEAITGMERVEAPTTVYNLQTDDPNTFFAHGLAVHNKGCFPAGTMIVTPAGPRAIETLAVGDTIRAVTDDGRTIDAPVLAVHQARDRIVTLSTRWGLLHTTAEHPLRMWDGSFEVADDLAPGAMLTYHDDGLYAAKLRWVRQGDVEEPVFNLTVGGPHTFIADHYVVHNKGGCFAAGTQILRWPASENTFTPIETLQPGDLVTGVDAHGDFVAVTVSKLYKESGTVLEVATDHGTLRTTPEHPLQTSGHRFVAAEQLHVGQEIAMIVDGRPQSAKVLGLTHRDVEQPVYNLSVDGPHTFVADGFIVHNKGGGGGGGGGHSSSHSGGSSSSTQPGDDEGWAPFIFIGAIGGLYMISWALKVAFSGEKSNSDDDELDYVFPRTKINNKSERTTRLAESLCKTDPIFDTAKLLASARDTFLLLQQCWEQRNYVRMQPLLTPELYAQHILQLSQMMQHHEINCIKDLRVEAIDLVHLDYGATAAERHATVLITARARDYYIDDRTQAFRRGDQVAQQFQEFWVFHLTNGQWILADIEQARESDILTQENIVATWTPEQLRAFYDSGIAAPTSGPPAPAAPSGEISRFDRALAQLAAAGPQCTPDAILTQARTLYVAVMSARQTTDPNCIGMDGLGPELLELLRKDCTNRQQAQIDVEYRNFCIRKAQIVSVGSKIVGQRQCVVRIIAHAQQVRMSGDKILSQDPYEKTFEEFLTLRYDNQWMLVAVDPKH